MHHEDHCTLNRRAQCHGLGEGLGRSWLCQLVGAGLGRGLGLNWSEVHACGAGLGLNRSEVHACGAGLGLNRSEVHACGAGLGLYVERHICSVESQWHGV